MIYNITTRLPIVKRFAQTNVRINHTVYKRVHRWPSMHIKYNIDLYCKWKYSLFLIYGWASLNQDINFMIQERKQESE